MGEALAEVSSEEGMVQSQAGGTARLGWVSSATATATWGQSRKRQGDCSSCIGAPEGGRPHLGWLEVR